MHIMSRGPDGLVYGFDSVSDIPLNHHRMSEEEIQAHLNPAPTDQEIRDQFKVQRAEAVARIVVQTFSGRTFDGDEISQGRMARAIVALSGEPEGTTVDWVLADNSHAEVDQFELREALKLAGLRQTELWIQGNP